ncbi:MAG: DUF350 domain-containing protein [Spirochaetes bacterium]|nr:DUF350 domain-containing protein [Spirochaetota bacterium]
MFKHDVFESLSTLPSFGAYLGLSLGLTALFLLLYTLVTPYNEIRLIRQGQAAPALSLGGALLGFVIPLTAVVRSCVSPLDLLVWGMIALVIQLLAFLIVRLLIPGLVVGITEGKTSHGIFLGVVSVAMGLLNGACITP